MRSGRLAAVTVIGAMFAVPTVPMSAAVAAQMSAADAISQFKAHDPNASSYILGLKTGFEEANAELWLAQKAEIYCQPLKLGLSVDQAIDIIEQYINDRPDMRNKPLAYVMFSAMNDVFPCKAAK
jgi:hypothetical protein